MTALSRPGLWRTSPVDLLPAAREQLWEMSTEARSAQKFGIDFCGKRKNGMGKKMVLEFCKVHQGSGHIRHLPLSHMADFWSAEVLFPTAAVELAGGQGFR